jgi:hypothetical protein
MILFKRFKSMAAAENIRTSIQTSIEEGLSRITLNGTKIDITPDGNSVVYTQGMVQTKPAVNDAFMNEPLHIGKDFNSVSAYGVKIESMTDGSLIVYTNGAVITKPVPVSDPVIPVAVYQIGDCAPDGWKYCGISEDTQKPLFVAPQDAERTDWYEATRGAEALQQAGKTDCRLPSSNELNQIFNHRAKIGGFNDSIANAAYVSSTENSHNSVQDQRMSDGRQGSTFKEYYACFVRYVRS